MVEDLSSPQNCSSYSTIEQFFNSQTDNIPPFLESVEDNFNEEISSKRSRIGEIKAENESGSELYSSEGYFHQNSENNNNDVNEYKINLDQLKQEWEGIFYCNLKFL
jgi:hypothetical protein